jgi:hypothetical protein
MLTCLPSDGGRIPEKLLLVFNPISQPVWVGLGDLRRNVEKVVVKVCICVFGIIGGESVKAKFIKIRAIEVGVREGERNRVALCSEQGGVKGILGRGVELPFD